LLGIGERLTVTKLGESPPLGVVGNSAQIVITREIFGNSWTSATLYLNGKKINDSLKKREAPLVIFVRPGLYELKADMYLGLCRMAAPLQLPLTEFERAVVHVGFTDYNPMGIPCAIYPLVKKLERIYMPSPAVSKESEIFFFGEKKPRLIELSESGISEIRASHRGLVIEEITELKKAGVGRLLGELEHLESKIREHQAALEKIRLEGDGSAEDIACKKRNIRPATAAYGKCYKDQTTARLKREKAAAEAADRQRLIAEREANDPLADAKMRCLSIGLQPKTEAFGKCVLELSK
jgi:hypothetical protein